MSGHSFVTAATFYPVPESVAALQRKLCTARRVALRSGVLKRCAVHHQVFYDDQDPAPAFELMLDLFKDKSPEVSEYAAFRHELLDVLSQVIADALPYCAECRAGLVAGWELQGSEAQ